jgi:hypothetical protein
MEPTEDSIKDLGEAINLLSVYGEKCALCIHPSIREKAYEEFKKIKTKPNA